MITDLKKRKIYNIALLPMLLFGLVFNLATVGWPGLLQSVYGIMTGLSILIIPFALGGMGAGDVKLLAVIGAVKGPLFVFVTAVGMGLAGGLIALCVLAYQGKLMDILVRLVRGIGIVAFSRFKTIEFGFENTEIMLPYGLAIVIGVVGAYWWMR